jgi:hypothetical protein
MRGPAPSARHWCEDRLAADLAAEGDRTLLRTLLAHGGDERVWPDPTSGRNRYGTLLSPAPEEAWYSSSTATTISAASFEVARLALGRLLGRHGTSMPIDEWFDALRGNLLALFGGTNSEVVLAPSGTEGELIALAIAERLAGPAITNVIIAPGETGSGVPLAAAGNSFLASSSLGGVVEAGRRLAGWEGADIEIACVEIRGGDGAPRAGADVDRDAAIATERALARGRGVLLHVLDASKTGLRGVSRAAARDIAAGAAGRVLVVVDACQLRCAADQIRSDLERGCMVLTTGSKFAAGPPFSGALLLPEGMADRLRSAPKLPAGFVGLSAQQDWPRPLQSSLADDLGFVNVGLGLRWTAALAELKSLVSVDGAIAAAILAHFQAEVTRRARQVSFAAPLNEGGLGTPSIVPLIARNRRGGAARFAEAAKLHAALRQSFHATAPWASPPVRRAIHVGQPVALGERSVLRICASAANVVDVARRLDRGATMREAFAAIAADLDDIFSKWRWLVEACPSEP